jgi:predicted PurR-regulated permease PerM
MGMIDSVINVAMPFLIGFGIAFLLLPVMGKLEWLFSKVFCRRKAHPKLCRMLATILSVLFLLAILATFFAILLPQLITSIKSILQYIASFVMTNRERINQLLLQFEFLSIEGEQLVIAWEKIVSQMMNYTSLVLNNAMAIAGGISNGVYTVIFHFLVGLIAAFYLMIDKETFAAQIKKLCYACFKRPTCETLIYWTRRANKIFAGFITGKILDSMIIGMFCYVLMVVFNIEYSVLISVIIGLTNVIPFFGPFIGAVPCILILLLVNPVSALWFAVMILILQQLDGNVIGPFILGDYVGVSAFWIMLAIVLGGGLFGFAGMLLGVPVFALVYAIVRTVADVQLKKADLPTDSAFYRNAPGNLHDIP